MRYILIRKKTVLLDQETGTRYSVSPEIAHLFNKKKVSVFKNPFKWKDPLPLALSIKMANDVGRDTWRYYGRRLIKGRVKS